jgi:hypothetical protein
MNDMQFQLPEINTWRLFLKGVSQQGVVQMVHAWEAAGYRFGAVCIDDGWTTDGRLGDWEPDPQRFPDMRGLVEWLHGKGYGVRLWIAPAQLHPDTDIHRRAQPDALLRDAQGNPSFYSGLGTYRLDVRHPIAIDHIRATMQRMVRQYDFDAFKVDFPPFFEPFDEFYKAGRFDLDEAAARQMVPRFYQIVRQAVEEVKPAARICCAKDLAHCQAHLHDTICGDFVNQQRSDEMLVSHCQQVLRYVGEHDITPWLEMVWGGGGDSPVGNPGWHTGFLEYIAHSINFGLKIEHSFQPFNYPNAHQIRTLTNLYGPRNRRYKVLAAGRKSWTVETLLNWGIPLDHQTRFLVAPEDDANVTLHTGFLDTSALQWRCHDLTDDRPVQLLPRNEYWPGSMRACRLVFEPKGRHVYEIHHEGEPSAYYRYVHEQHVRPWLTSGPPTRAELANGS